MERHFKGHRDIVTCVDFNPNMKQIGRSQLSLFTITSEDHPSLIETLSILKYMYILRKSPNCGIASKIRISATPTNVYDRAYIVLHVYNSNFEQPIRFLVTITIKRRLAV